MLKKIKTEHYNLMAGFALLLILTVAIPLIAIHYSNDKPEAQAALLIVESPLAKLNHQIVPGDTAMSIITEHPKTHIIVTNTTSHKYYFRKAEDMPIELKDRLSEEYIDPESWYQLTIDFTDSGNIKDINLIKQ